MTDITCGNSALADTYKRLPVSFSAGDGAWLIDENGERYLDALSGIAVCSLGHANHEISAVLAEQAKTLVHTSNLYQISLQEELAGRLCQLSGMDKVFFCNSGAEANEAAIKMCRRYAHAKSIGAPVIVTMQGSFHGRTFATMSATANQKIQEGFAPLLNGFQHIPYNDTGALQALGSENNIIAVLVEPVQGEGGVVIPDPGYLKDIRSICDEHGWLLVLDEVQTGLCRTGKWFACQHEDVMPDILTIAKSLGNGVPVGACLANLNAAEAMTSGSHGSTFGGNPLVSRVALSVVDIMHRQNMADRVALLGDTMLNMFTEKLAGSSLVRDIRGRGLMLGIELNRACGELVECALDKRLLINVTAGNVIRLLPPFIINEDELNYIVNRTCELIQEFEINT